jgi:hypothetical protein
MGRLPNRLPTGAVWLSNEVPVRRVSPAVWLQRGALADCCPEVRRARRGLCACRIVWR